jgi:hypothetical protein
MQDHGGSEPPTSRTVVIKERSRERKTSFSSADFLPLRKSLDADGNVELHVPIGPGDVCRRVSISISPACIDSCSRSVDESTDSY